MNRPAGARESRLKPWHRRRAKTPGADAPDGTPAPLVDQAHRLMQLRRGGDESKVNAASTRAG